MRRLAGDGVTLAVLDEGDGPPVLLLHGFPNANASPEQELRRTRPFPAVDVPTMGIWSSGDNYLTEDGMIRSAEHVTGTWRYEPVEGAGHWLQLDQPDRLNELLLDFLTSHG